MFFGFSWHSAYRLSWKVKQSMESTMQYCWSNWRKPFKPNIHICLKESAIQPGQHGCFSTTLTYISSIFSAKLLQLCSKLLLHASYLTNLVLSNYYVFLNLRNELVDKDLLQMKRLWLRQMFILQNRQVILNWRHTDKEG